MQQQKQLTPFNATVSAEKVLLLKVSSFSANISRQAIALL